VAFFGSARVKETCPLSSIGPVTISPEKLGGTEGLRCNHRAADPGIMGSSKPGGRGLRSGQRGRVGPIRDILNLSDFGQGGTRKRQNPIFSNFPLIIHFSHFKFFRRGDKGGQCVPVEI